MKFRPIAPAIALILGIALPAAAEPLPSPLSPHTAVVYNASIPESKKLAELYAEARAIPEENLIGLICPKDETADRFMFETTIQKPLRDTFEKRGWWRMAQTNQGPQAQANKIRVMVLSWGVPLRIKWEPPPAERDPETGKPVPQKQDPFATEAASVDSELAVLGLPSAAIKGAINNPYYKARKGILEANIPQILLVGRLDGPSAVVAGERVRDAIEAEREGLWGMAYLDLALKGEGYEEGDDWINAAADLYGEHGIPYAIDRNKSLLPNGYPMSNAILYFGWYAGTQCGMMKDPQFKFRKGAIACHLHSFSAQSVRTAQFNWVGPLANRGAAATIGNVWEPYLGLTCDFGILNEALLEGRTFIEATYESHRALSWMAVAVGDPLYRPFADRSKPAPEGDAVAAAFQAYYAADQTWKGDELAEKLAGACEKMKSGPLAEAIGLRAEHEGDAARADTFFKKALAFYPDKKDQVRIHLHLVERLRQAGDESAAIRLLAKIAGEFKGEPGVEGAQNLLKQLSPPLPPAPPNK